MHLSEIPSRIREAVKRRALSYEKLDKRVKKMLVTTLEASGMFPVTSHRPFGTITIGYAPASPRAAAFCAIFNNYAVSTYIRCILTPTRKRYVRGHDADAGVTGADGGMTLPMKSFVVKDEDHRVDIPSTSVRREGQVMFG